MFLYPLELEVARVASDACTLSDEDCQNTDVFDCSMPDRDSKPHIFAIISLQGTLCLLYNTNECLRSSTLRGLLLLFLRFWIAPLELVALQDGFDAEEGCQEFAAWWLDWIARHIQSSRRGIVGRNMEWERVL